jgi:protein TonB
MDKGSSAGLAAAVAFHAAALAALLSYEPARSALAAAAPIMVDWIAAPKAEPVIQPPEPAKPRPVQHRPRPIEKPKIIAAPAESPSPSPILVPAPPPPPPEPIALAPAPEPVVAAPPVFDAAYLQNPAPAYPTLSRKLGEQGRVILRVLVNPKGTADQVQLQTSSGYARLDESARETIARWKFVPAKRGSEPVADWVLIPINFRLNG